MHIDEIYPQSLHAGEQTDKLSKRPLEGVQDQIRAMEERMKVRFARAERLASYAGTVPDVKTSGDKVRYIHTPHPAPEKPEDFAMQESKDVSHLSKPI